MLNLLSIGIKINSRKLLNNTSFLKIKKQPITAAFLFYTKRWKLRIKNEKLRIGKKAYYLILEGWVFSSKLNCKERKVCKDFAKRNFAKSLRT